MSETAHRTEWLHEAKWGVFIHFLAAPASSSGGPEIDAETWLRRVDAFDVAAVAAQLREVGARYLILTLGQNSGHYCVPNATYDRLVGVRPSRCARRDLVAELHAALAPHGIRLMVYLTAGAPEFEPAAVARLQWAKGGRCAEFQRHWEEVIREWSLRWGPQVSGWWFDCCYFNDEMYRHPEPPNFASFAAAARAGNPAALVAWNPGVLYPPCTVDPEEDYTAGEVNEPQLVDALGRRDRQAQFHVLTFLGSFWGEGPVRFTAPEAIAHTLAITNHGGVFSWDAPPAYDGTILPEALAVLKAVGQAVDATRGRPDLPPPPVVQATLGFVRTPAAEGEAEPAGRVAVTLRNRWPARIAGEARLAGDPAGIARFERDGRLPYDLAPGAETRTELDFTLARSAVGNLAARLLLSRPGAPAPLAYRLPSRERLVLPRIAPLADPDQVAAALQDAPSRKVLTAQGRTLAEIWLAVAGDRLALSCRVPDQLLRQTPKLWDGSCLEVFGIAAPGDRIAQLFLVPATAAAPAAAWRLAVPADGNMSKADPVPAPEIGFATRPGPGGYAATALIPLPWWLGRPAAPDRFYLEIAVSAGVDTHAFGRAAMFGNLDASHRSDGYALVELAPGGRLDNPPPSR